jgi:hypothetical protein
LQYRIVDRALDIIRQNRPRRVQLEHTQGAFANVRFGPAFIRVPLSTQLNVGLVYFRRRGVFRHAQYLVGILDFFVHDDFKNGDEDGLVIVWFGLLS